MGQLLRIRIPTILLDWQMPQEGQRGEGTSGFDSPSVEVQAVVYSFTGTASGIPPGNPINIPTLGKKRVVGAPPKQVSFGAFPDDDYLCVAKTVQPQRA